MTDPSRDQDRGGDKADGPGGATAPDSLPEGVEPADGDLGSSDTTEERGEGTEPRLTANGREVLAGDAEPRTSPAKPPRRGKPEFDEFLEDLRRAITDGSKKDNLAQVAKILKAGYSGKPTAFEIDAIFSVFKDWPNCNRLAIQLSVQTRGKRSSELIRFLRNRLVSYARECIGYPVAEERPTDQAKRSESLIQWIEQHEEAGESNRGATTGSFDLEWSRWAIACLMEEPHRVRTGPLYAILDGFASEKDDDDESEGMGFLLEVGNIFGAEKLNIPKLLTGWRLSSAARDSARLARKELVKASATIESLNTRLAGLSERTESLESSLSAANDRIAESEGVLAAKEREIEQEREERGMDQQHWEAMSEQRLVRLTNEISGRLAHEIKEAKLCLSDESPNIRMALDRLRQMDKWLSKLRAD